MSGHNGATLGAGAASPVALEVLKSGSGPSGNRQNLEESLALETPMRVGGALKGTAQPLPQQPQPQPPLQQLPQQLQPRPQQLLPAQVN